MVTMERHSTLDSAAMLRVTNTGVGVPADLNIDQPRCLGWQLVTMLTKQLHGIIDLDRDQGTRITMRFPH